MSGQRFREADLTDADLRVAPLQGPDASLRAVGGSGVLLLRGASTDGVDWRAFELTGVRLDLAQAVQVARAHGASVAD